MCTSLYRLRLKCQRSHNSQKGDLKPDSDDSTLGLSVQLLKIKSAGPSSALRMNLFKGQHAQEKTTYSPAHIEHFQKHVDTNISKSTCYQTENHNLHGAISQSITPTPSIQSKRRTLLCGDFTCQDAKMTWTGSHDSCVIGCQSWVEVVWSERERKWERKRLMTGAFQVTYMTVGSHGSCHHRDTLKSALHYCTVHLSLNHISS